MNPKVGDRPGLLPVLAPEKLVLTEILVDVVDRYFASLVQTRKKRACSDVAASSKLTVADQYFLVIHIVSTVKTLFELIEAFLESLDDCWQNSRSFN